ncbi:MAG: hypothetical protein ACR2QT_13080 [Woeseiaceae bacterium]
MTAIRWNFLRLLGLTGLVACVAVAQAGESFPGYAPAEVLIETQQKADKLFEIGDYKRAMLIYRQDLSPLGDKFAQYMVGYMHYSGRGVDEDPVIASAWYRLAAERGVQDYVRVRDALMSLLDDEQRARSDVIFAELRTQMGDAALITQLVNQGLQSLTARRGDGSISDERFEGMSFSQELSMRKATVTRLRQRIDYLVEYVATDPSASDLERDKIKYLEEEVRREIEMFEASIR